MKTATRVCNHDSWITLPLEIMNTNDLFINNHVKKHEEGYCMLHLQRELFGRKLHTSSNAITKSPCGDMPEDVCQNINAIVLGGELNESSKVALISSQRLTGLTKNL